LTWPASRGKRVFLKAAAALLDAEATELSAQIGRLPEQRMLLMAGLMLADKMATLKLQLAQAEEKLAQLAENQTGNDSERLDAESLSILNRLVERGEELAALGR